MVAGRYCRCESCSFRARSERVWLAQIWQCGCGIAGAHAESAVLEDGDRVDERSAPSRADSSHQASTHRESLPRSCGRASGRGAAKSTARGRRRSSVSAASRPLE